jgi:hypothetical protein
MKSQTISPTKQKLESNGSLTYDEPLRAWAHVRFKKEIIQEFSILKKRDIKFSYQILLHRSFSELEKEIKQMKKNNGAIPLLLLIRKG